MYIVGCRGLLKVSGTTPFVYQLLGGYAMDIYIG